MRRRMGGYLWVALVVSFLAPAFAVAQLPGSTAPIGVGTGVQFQSFQFRESARVGIESLSLLSIPVAAQIRVGNSIRVEGSTTWARGRMERPGGGFSEIAGPTDSQVRVVADLVRDRISLNGIYSIPTGADRFTREQASLAGAVAADLLPFSLSSWGSGGGLGGGILLFQPMGRLGVGLSGGYLVPGEFAPVDEAQFQYRPGAALSVGGIVAYNVGLRGRALFQGSFQRFEEDQLQGQNLFRSGDRLQLRGSYAFGLGERGSGVLYGGALRRSEGAFLEDLQTRPAQDLIFSGVGLRIPQGRWVWVPAADLRIQRREDGRDQGSLGGLGLRAEIPAAYGVLIPNVHLRAGSVLLRKGVHSRVMGVDLGLSIRQGGGGR